MSKGITSRRFRFGLYEADAGTGELRRQGLRIRLNAQPFQVLMMLLERPGEVLTRDEIARELWPEGTFVDFDHGVNSAVNRIREALGDKASNPRFVETLSRRGYRFVAPVERLDVTPAEADDAPLAFVEIRETPVVDAASGVSAELPTKASIGFQILALPEELPSASQNVVKWLLVGMQLMYLAFYVGALANLPEIEELLSPLAQAHSFLAAIVVTAAVMIPVRAFVLSAVLFRAPGARGKFLKLWPLMLVMDVAWSMSPFLLLHHINVGLAFACCSLLVYAPFAQRSLVLMGAADSSNAIDVDKRER